MKRLAASLTFLIALAVPLYAAPALHQIWIDDSGNAVSGAINTANPLPVTITGGAAGSSVNIVDVAGAAVKTGAGTAAGSLRVELPTDGTGKIGLNAGAAIVGKVGIDQTTDGTTNAVHAIAGTAVIGKVGIDQTTDGTTNAVHVIAGTAVIGHVIVDAGSATIGNVGLAAGTTGGCTPYHLLSAANNNATNIKNAAATLCYVSAINTTGTLYYLKFFNQAAAPSTCTTDAANVVLNFPIPASTAGAGFTIPLGPYGTAFSTGLSFCITAGSADNDNTSAATGVNLNLGYK